MDTTDGLVRGQRVTDTGSPISVPVGPATLGRIINVIGEPIDERGEVGHTRTLPIHRSAPDFVDQSTEAQVLVTGIKVIDLLAPYSKGGKIGLFGGAGVGKTVTIMELINNVAPSRWTPPTVSSVVRPSTTPAARSRFRSVPPPWAASST